MGSVPQIVNNGHNGFHLLTIVSDGYGNIIAEDQSGNEMARVRWDLDAPDATAEILKVAQKAIVNFAHQDALDNPPVGL